MVSSEERALLASIPNSVAIPRKSQLSRDATDRDHMAGEGAPVVVTDAQAGWAAARTWSFEHLARTYGGDQLIASDKAPLRLEDSPRAVALRTTMAEFVRYVLRPEGTALAARERECGAPFYANSWAPFNDHPELLADIGAPYFVADMMAEDPECPADLSHQFTKVFLGPAGTLTRLHNDSFATHAWLSQIRGRKQFILYPPSQARLLHASEGVAGGHGAEQTWFDPLRPDFRRFPRARDATAHIAVCEEGETVLVPSGWFHHAVSLSPSITLMRNFVNQANFDAFQRLYAAPRPAAPQRAPPEPAPVGAPKPAPLAVARPKPPVAAAPPAVWSAAVITAVGSVPFARRAARTRQRWRPARRADVVRR